jgi:hypothetical protein
MSVEPEDILAVAGESLEYIETTSVDGRSYVSIEDLLALVYANKEAILDVVAQYVGTGDLDQLQLFGMEMKVEGMAVILAQFAQVLIAANDKESIESLSPGDFA